MKTITTNLCCTCCLLTHYFRYIVFVYMICGWQAMSQTSECMPWPFVVLVSHFQCVSWGIFVFHLAPTDFTVRQVKYSTFYTSEGMLCKFCYDPFMSPNIVGGPFILLLSLFSSRSQIPQTTEWWPSKVYQRLNTGSGSRNPLSWFAHTSPHYTGGRWKAAKPGLSNAMKLMSL